MQLGERVRSRMGVLGLSQAELGRRVGLSQPAIHALITRNKSGTKSLHRIARELQTTPAYLMGEIEDPDENAPPPPPSPLVQHVLMQVALPSQPALERMFLGLLMALPEDVPQAEHARLLAKWLPTGLAQLRDLLPHDPTPSAPYSFPPAPPAARPQEPEREPAEALAIHDREPR